jgi:hypothetical protein
MTRDMLTVRDHRGNVAQVPWGGTSRQIALECAWWWGYTITRSDHFAVQDSDGNVIPFEEVPFHDVGDLELVVAGGTV